MEASPAALLTAMMETVIGDGPFRIQEIRSANQIHWT
jgi:hypothetical protein